MPADTPTSLDHHSAQDSLSAPLQDTSSPEGRDERRCGREKGDGTPCKAYKVKGRDACAGHLGLGIAEDPSRYAGMSAVSRQEKAAERRRTPKDVYSQALVDHAEALVGRLVAIAQNGDDSEALRAIEQLTSRVLGKPKETVEQQLDRPAGLAAVATMSREERDALWRQLIAEDTQPAQ